MSDFETVDWFTDPAVNDDPFPYLAHLREQCPVQHLPKHDVMAVTSYGEAWEIWRNHEVFSSCNSVTGPFPGLPVEAEGDDITDLIAQYRDKLPMHDHLVASDPPVHTANRALLMRLLTPKRMKENEDFIRTLAAQQADEVIARGTFEALSEFAAPYATLVIADLLGVPMEDHTELAAKLGVRRAGRDVHKDMDTERRPARDPLAFLFETFSAYVEDRRREPRSDVLTHLATATYPDGTLPEVPVVVRTATFLFAAGQDTTARLIMSALRKIGEDAELQQLLRDQPELVPNFVEEVLRLEGPVKTISRLARVTSTVGGVDIPAGTTIAVFPHAVNRDPDNFEAPDELRIDRPNVKEHVAFGRGIHSCPGGPLARVEAKVALETLLARTSEIRISEAVHGPPGDRHFPYEPTYVLRGLKTLQLEASPAPEMP